MGAKLCHHGDCWWPGPPKLLNHQQVQCWQQSQTWSSKNTPVISDLWTGLYGSLDIIHKGQINNFPSSYSPFWMTSSGGRFKKTNELLNLRALKISPVNKIHIFQCMGKIFCVEFQRYPLKFHTKYLTHTLKDMIFIQHRNLRALRFKSSYVFLKRPPLITENESPLSLTSATISEAASLIPDEK